MVLGSHSGVRRRLGTPLILQRQPHIHPGSPAAVEVRQAGDQQREAKEWDFSLLPRKKLPSFGPGHGYFCTSHSILSSHQEPDMVSG